MKLKWRTLLASILFWTLPALAQQGPVLFVGLMELSGTGATPGTNFDNGAKLAVKEINAAGGILGRKINYESWDTQTNPSVAKALAQKAIDQGAYVVLGPVHSGSMIVSMGETRRAEVTNFTGGEAATITQQGNPYVFRTSFTQSTSMPKLARYIGKDLKAKSVAILFTNNDFGKGGHAPQIDSCDRNFLRGGRPVRGTSEAGLRVRIRVGGNASLVADPAWTAISELRSAALDLPRSSGRCRAGSGRTDDQRRYA